MPHKKSKNPNLKPMRNTSIREIALGLIIGICVICFAGCQKADNDTQTVETSTVLLDPGQKLVSCGWRSHPNQVWYLTRPMAEGEAATEYRYQNNDKTALVIIKEEARRDLEDLIRHQRNLEAIGRMRLHE